MAKKNLKLADTFKSIKKPKTVQPKGHVLPLPLRPKNSKRNYGKLA